MTDQRVGMNYEDYISFSSEITELEALLTEIPAENLIERMGLEARLESARKRVAGIAEQGRITPEVTPEVRAMLSVLTAAMSRGEIMNKLGLTDEKHFRKHYQQTSIKLGLIEMTIPDKPTSSKQKYRLTEKGKQLLAASNFSTGQSNE